MRASKLKIHRGGGGILNLLHKSGAKLWKPESWICSTKVEQNFEKPNVEFAPQKWSKTFKNRILNLLHKCGATLWKIYFSDKSLSKLKEFLMSQNVFGLLSQRLVNLNCNLLEQWEKCLKSSFDSWKTCHPIEVLKQKVHNGS